MQSRNRFLNEYENYCIIKRLLELNSPVETGDPALVITRPCGQVPLALRNLVICFARLRIQV
jgi:hypothetical protein